MNKAVRRALAATTVCAALASAVAITPVAAAESGPAKQGREVSDFGYKGDAVGARLYSGNVEHLHARQTAAPLNCSRMTGRNVTNRGLLSSPEGSLIQLSDATSQTTSYRNGQRFGVRATNRLGDIAIGVPDQTALVTLEGLTTTADAFHDAKGYAHEEKISYTRFTIELLPDTPVPTDGPLGDLLDAIGDGTQTGVGEVIQVLAGAGPIEIPGLGSIKLGNPRGHVSRYGADSSVRALQFDVDPDGTGTRERLQLAESKAIIGGPAPVGAFTSNSTPLSMSALRGMLGFGHVKPMVIPCEGTRGKVRQRHLSDANILAGDVVVNLSDIDYSTMGLQRPSGIAKGFAKQKIGRVEIRAGKLLVIEDVVARANTKVRKPGGRVHKKLLSRVGAVTYDGTLLALQGATTELPEGAGVIERKIVEKRGTVVIGLRVTLFGAGPDGQGVVIDLAKAASRIDRR